MPRDYVEGMWHDPAAGRARRLRAGDRRDAARCASSSNWPSPRSAARIDWRARASTRRASMPAAGQTVVAHRSALFPPDRGRSAARRSSQGASRSWAGRPRPASPSWSREMVASRSRRGHAGRLPMASRSVRADRQDASRSPAIAAWSAARWCAGWRARAATILTAAPRARSTCAIRPRSKRWFAAERPQVVFLAAAKVGGIVANNTLRGRVPLRQSDDRGQRDPRGARRHGVEKLMFLGSSCIYPRLAPQPMREEALLTGPLEPTNESYAIAKIAGIKLARGLPPPVRRRLHQRDADQPLRAGRQLSPRIQPRRRRADPPLPRGQAVRRARRRWSGAPARRGASSCMSTTSPMPASI